MNCGFMTELMERTGFPEEAKEAILKLAGELDRKLDELVAVFASAYDYEETDLCIEALARERGVSPYGIWMAVLVSAAEQARPHYRDDRVFYDTFSDLRYKAFECYERYGIWGTFVAFWYPRFYRGGIVKLGRMEYEIGTYKGSEPISMLGMTLNPGDPLLHLHIPSSPEPFYREVREDSYRLAREYFGRPLVCVCNSWMLWPGYEPLLPEDSNIADFRREFRLLSQKQTEEFADGWRIFGAAWDGPMENLPEKSRLQRAFKTHLLGGGSVGTGLGVLIFDEDRVLTRNA